MKILLLEDDKRIADNIKFYLSKFSYNVEIASTFKQAEKLCLENEYNLYILDRMLSDGSGDEILKMIRNNGVKAPVIMLSALSQLDDKIEGLNLGADDYVTKPFHLPELLARIKALLRRPTDVLISPIIEISDLKIDTNNRQVTRNGKIIELSPKLYLLLELLASNPNVIFTREEILEKVWDEFDAVKTNTVDVHIRYLRKLVDVGFKEDLIKTSKGKGYYICSV